jgi:hypothetical protein
VSRDVQQPWFALVVVEPLPGYGGVVPDGATGAYVRVAALAGDEAEFTERITASARQRCLELTEVDSVSDGCDESFDNAEAEREWRTGVATGDVLWDTTMHWY